MSYVISIISQIFNKKPNFLNSGGKDEITMITHIMENENLFEKINPNYVIVYGDTTSTLPALATKIKKSL